MSDEMMQQLMATAERLASAAESLDRVLVSPLRSRLRKAFLVTKRLSVMIGSSGEIQHCRRKPAPSSVRKFLPLGSGGHAGKQPSTTSDPFGYPRAQASAILASQSLDHLLSREEDNQII